MKDHLSCSSAYECWQVCDESVQLQPLVYIRFSKETSEAAYYSDTSHVCHGDKRTGSKKICLPIQNRHPRYYLGDVDGGRFCSQRCDPVTSSVLHNIARRQERLWLGTLVAYQYKYVPVYICSSLRSFLFPEMVGVRLVRIPA